MAVTFSSGEDMLQEFHNRNLMILGWATLPFLVPFIINSFIQNRPLLGALAIILIIIAVVNSYSLNKYHRYFIPIWCYSISIFLTLLYAMISIGANALYWYYPYLLGVFFLNDSFIARINAIAIFAILVPYSYYLFDLALVIRFIFTLAMLCYLSDVLVSRQTRLQLRMAELIIRDPLTNAFNRRHMNSCIQMVIEETKRGLGPVSLLLLDIDHFKNINDSFGHEVGDQVLKKLIDILHKRQRRIDYVFRSGGEEFVILLRNTELNQAVRLAENLRKNIAETLWLEDQKITISLGVAQYQTDESDDEWLKRADDNMYKAKNQGRNRVCPTIGDLS